jgi:3-dehydroquinate synthase
VVVLAGFMGVGKTDVGRALAAILGVEFIDTDALIEQAAGKTIAQIFETEGEGRFRQLERGVCRGLSPAGGAVIATGGGMVVDDDNFQRLSALGTMVLLTAGVDAIVERLRGSGSRPLLPEAGDSGDDLRTRVESLLEERKPAYRRIKFRFNTTGRPPDETAAEIASLLGAGCRVIHMDVEVRPLPQTNGNAVAEHPRECRIVIGRGAASALGTYMRDAGLGSRAFLFMPKHLIPKFLDRIKPSLDAASIPHEAVPIVDGDANKNLAQVRDLLDRLAVSGAGRDSAVVSVGGGVTGDVSGFVAATYMRGIPFIQIPTTLVSQVDASIGGKVGVNHPRAKNLIGAIYQPVLVLNDPLLLEGLPLREIANGMAEVMKTAIIGSPALYGFIHAVIDEPADKTLTNAAFLEYCTFEAARVKADIVESDPYERDRRRLLNLGHTLGHALESAMEYEGIKHGEAVSLGTIAAIRVAVERGRANRAFLDKTIAILEWCGLPTRTPQVDRDMVRRALKLDKKIKSGNLFFILPLRAGEVEIVGDITEDELLNAL